MAKRLSRSDMAASLRFPRSPAERSCTDRTSAPGRPHGADASSSAAPCRPGTAGYAGAMEDAGRPRVRLAELVASLSLGVDLGFGQPMEHVLRQCWIALRLADQIGLGDDERAVV